MSDSEISHSTVGARSIECGLTPKISTSRCCDKSFTAISYDYPQNFNRIFELLLRKSKNCLQNKSVSQIDHQSEFVKFENNWLHRKCEMYLMATCCSIQYAGMHDCVQTWSGELTGSPRLIRMVSLYRFVVRSISEHQSSSENAVELENDEANWISSNPTLIRFKISSFDSVEAEEIKSRL